MCTWNQTPERMATAEEAKAETLQWPCTAEGSVLTYDYPQRRSDVRRDVVCTTVTVQVPVHVTLHIGQIDTGTRYLAAPGTYLLGGMPRLSNGWCRVSLTVRLASGVDEVPQPTASVSDQGEGGAPASQALGATACTVASTFGAWPDDMRHFFERHFGRPNISLMKLCVQRKVYTFHGKTVHVPCELACTRLIVQRPALTACSIYLVTPETRVLIGAQPATNGRVCFELECALCAWDDLEIVAEDARDNGAEDAHGDSAQDAHGDSAGVTTVELERINFLVTDMPTGLSGFRFL
jgi:hypothetical protein